MKKTFWLSALLLSVLVVTTSWNQQLVKTQLRITVIDNLGNFVNEAKVTLYKNESDYNSGKAAFKTLETDKLGKVIFKNVEAIPYFIAAEKGKLNNFLGGEMTDSLEFRKINKVNVIVSE